MITDHDQSPEKPMSPDEILALAERLLVASDNLLEIAVRQLALSRGAHVRHLITPVPRAGSFPCPDEKPKRKGSDPFVIPASYYAQLGLLRRVA